MPRNSLGQVIVQLIPRSEAAKDILDVTTNAVWVQDDGPDHTINLRFDVQPRDIQRGYSFGSDPELCDVLLPGTRYGKCHFSFTFNSSTGVLLLVNKCSLGVVIGTTALNKRGSSQVVERKTLLKCGRLEFYVRIPDRGQLQKEYESCLGRWIGYLKNSTESTVGTAYGTPIHVYRKVGPYLEVDKLGSGGFGDVVLLTHGASGEVVAGKRFRGGGTSDVEREIKTLQALSHSHISKFIDVIWEKNQSACLIMEYLPHGHLGQIKNLTQASIFSSLRQCLEAVSYLHRRNVMHRDIKPNNITMLSQFPVVVKLIDFGLAHVGNRSSQKCGTTIYMAPEMILRKDYDNKVDVWALGLTALELLGGLPSRECAIFAADQHPRNLHAYIEAIYRSLSRLPTNIDKFLNGMLHPTPEKRWTADQCLAQLSSVNLQFDPLQAAPRKPKPQIPRVENLRPQHLRVPGDNRRW